MHAACHVHTNAASIVLSSNITYNIHNTHTVVSATLSTELFMINYYTVITNSYHVNSFLTCRQSACNHEQTDFSCCFVTHDGYGHCSNTLIMCTCIPWLDSFYKYISLLTKNATSIIVSSSNVHNSQISEMQCTEEFSLSSDDNYGLVKTNNSLHYYHFIPRIILSL